MAMACTTITVVQQKPTISGLVATPRATQTGYVDVTWSQDIVGSVVIKVDGAVIISGIFSPYSTLLTGVVVGSHSICVDAL